MTTEFSTTTTPQHYDKCISKSLHRVAGSFPRFRPRNIKQYFALLLFGVFAGSAVAQSTRGQPDGATTLTYNDGDLFLGFRATDRTSDYLVNIGQPTQFVNAAPGSTFPVAVGSTSADLATAFGADWYTRIDPNTGRNAVLWAVVGGRQIGASGDPDNTLYSTNPVANPWPPRSGYRAILHHEFNRGDGQHFCRQSTEP